jgi:hypothetical protein
VLHRLLHRLLHLRLRLHHLQPEPEVCFEA